MQYSCKSLRFSDEISMEGSKPMNGEKKVFEYWERINIKIRFWDILQTIKNQSQGPI